MPPLWFAGVVAGALVGFLISTVLFYSPAMFIRADMKTKIGSALVVIPCMLVGLCLGLTLETVWR